MQRPANLEQAAKKAEQSVHIYNYERPHAELKYKTPDTVNLIQDLTPSVNAASALSLGALHPHNQISKCRSAC